MSKTTLGNIIKLMYEKACTQGRKVNHSIRKTAITTNAHAEIPSTILHQHSGHKKNLALINNNSTDSINQQKGMSELLSSFSEGATTEASEKINNDVHEVNNNLPALNNVL